MDNNYNIVENKPVTTVTPSSILVFGILSLAIPSACSAFAALGFLGLFVIMGGVIAGLIFAIVARKKAKKLVAEGGVIRGAAKVGKILATIGFIECLVSVIICALTLIAMLVLYLIYGSAFLFSIFASFLSEMAIPFMFLF